MQGLTLIVVFNMLFILMTLMSGLDDWVNDDYDKHVNKKHVKKKRKKSCGELHKEIQHNVNKDINKDVVNIDDINDLFKKNE